MGLFSSGRDPRPKGAQKGVIYRDTRKSTNLLDGVRGKKRDRYPEAKPVGRKSKGK